MSTTDSLTIDQVKERISGLPEGQQKAVVCALVGHSRIQDYCFGYFTCARCGAHLGDSIGSVYPAAERAVIVGHNCENCRKNFAECDWRDTFMAPDPFAVETETAEVQP